MKIIFCLFLFLISVVSIQAQSPALQTYIIKTDTSAYQEIDNQYWQVLEDPTGKLALQDILGDSLHHQFYELTATTENKSKIASAHWFRFIIRNNDSIPADYSFSTRAQQSDYYVFVHGRQEGHLVTGDGYPWHKKDGLKKANAVPWTIPAGTEVLVYQRRYNDRPSTITSDTKLRLYDTKKLQLAELKDYEQHYIEIPAIYLSFISGLLLLACIFNFLLFWQLKDRASLYFSLMLFCFFFLYSSSLREIVGRENHVAEQLFNTIGLSFIIFFLLFVREYFEVWKAYPKWNKFIVVYSIVLAVLLYIDYLVPNTIIRDRLFLFRSYVIMGYVMSIGVTIILSFLTPGKKRKIFAIAILPFIIAVISISSFFWILNMINPITQAPDLFLWMPYILGFFMVWATIVFSSYLYKNYGKAQRQVVEAMLERERMALEQEQHRSAFIEKARIQLEHEVESRTAELKASLEELKSTQSQLIHAEKMASLGELTAGIAHEIQNPLNFVNNFSEVNSELIVELQDELEKGNYDDVKAIAGDIAENEKKINHHGKRADTIVKGMLQHSRSSNGVKEPTDINLLADEYFRLAYNGLRAKDKSFNVTMKTDFDQTIGLVNVVPQDISRVILNLVTNAFYAANEKFSAKSTDILPAQASSGDVPIVSVSTRKTLSGVEITVQDNGNGIPQKVMDKIFQPFFTTKPSGQGTGLGLSLSYDIVKAHGGELKVDSKSGEYASFSICLPLM